MTECQIMKDYSGLYRLIDVREQRHHSTSRVCLTWRRETDGLVRKETYGMTLHPRAGLRRRVEQLVSLDGLGEIDLETLVGRTLEFDRQGPFRRRGYRRRSIGYSSAAATLANEIDLAQGIQPRDDWHTFRSWEHYLRETGSL